MSNEPKAGPGLDPELLAAYVDQRLSPEQRAAVEAQLAADPDSHAVLVETMKAVDALKAPESVGTVHTVRKVPGIAITGGLLAAAATIALVVWTQPDLLRRLRGDAVDPRFEQLVAAVGEERYFDARLTGGFRFGPTRPVTRGSSELARQNLALLAAAGEVQKRAAADPSARNLHLWGAAQMLVGDIDAAIVTLQEANRLGSSPEIDADLSAAYLARAQTDDHPDDLARALAHATRAVDAMPQSREAWFNKALAETRLRLFDVADQSWQRFRSVERDQAWVNESQRIQSAARPQSRSAPERPDVTRLRELAETEGLAAWAAAAGTNDEGRVRAAIGELVAASTQAGAAGQDRYLQDVVASLQQGTGDAGQVATFARAMVLIAEDQQAQATLLLDRIEPSLCAWSPPLCASARLSAATALAAGADAGAYLRALETVDHVIADRPYHALKGILGWRRGLARLRRGEFEPAIAEYQEAIQLFSRAGERAHTANMHSLLAEAYRTLGDMPAAWRQHLLALNVLPADAPPRITHQILAQVSLSCLAMELPECALGAQTQAMSNAHRWGRASGKTMVHVQRARALARMGRPEAMAELREASALLDAIPDESFRARVEAEVLNAAGELLVLPDGDGSLEAVDKGVRWFDQTGAANRAAALRLTRGRYLAGESRRDEARTDFTQGVGHLERSRNQTSSATLRNAQAGPVAALLMELANLELQSGRQLSALDYVERSRARTVLDAPALGAAPPMSMPSIQRAIDEKTAVIYYASDLAAPTAWIVTRSAIVPVTISTAPADLKRAVAEYRRSVEGGAAMTGFAASRQRLYDFLVAPIRAAAGAQPNWVIVPDATIAGVALGSLRDREGKSLFASHFISVAPSGSVFARITRHAGPLTSSAFLAYGGADAAASLPPLPQVEREATEAAANYRSPALTLGRAATAEALRRALQQSDMVHISAHAVARAEYPGLSRLLLSPAGYSSSGYFYADQIAAVERVRARIVVLAGCRTGYAGPSVGAAGEGVLSLTAPFLQAGVSQVVATVWDVPDDRTRHLMSAFHRHLSATGDAVAALTHAQLELEGDVSNHAVVGAFQVYGAR